MLSAGAPGSSDRSGRLETGGANGGGGARFTVGLDTGGVLNPVAV